MRSPPMLALLVGVACSRKPAEPDTGKPGADDTSAVGDDTAVTDDGYCGVQQIFRRNCTICHQPTTGPLGDLDLETDAHAALVNVAAAADATLTLVVPGEPDASFLVAKMEGTMGEGAGTVMPPQGALPADVIAVVRAWIADGASESCDDTGTGGTGTYHPEGYAEPSVHGMEAKMHEQTCTTCHGADLAGGVGPSCDTCHQAEWRTTCTYCHGKIDNLTGAPPEDLDDRSTDLSFAAHSAHVVDTTLHAAFDCTTCHDKKPTDVLSPGHLFDDTPGASEVDLSLGLSPAGTWNGLACSNLYCHGNRGRNNGTLEHTATVEGCGACHAAITDGEAAWEARLTKPHDDHLKEGITCNECHGAVVGADSLSIVTTALHVNGVRDVALPDGMTRNAIGRCTGSCHGQNHNVLWVDD